MSLVEVQIKDKLAQVTLNRPEVRNAFNQEMIVALTKIFSDLGKEPIAGAVLSGAGKSFCAGADLNYMQAMSGQNFEENEADAKRLDEMFWTLRNFAKPLIVRVHGHVTGGGLGLTAAGDIVFAESATKFCFSEVKLGIAPAVISPYVLERSPSPLLKRFMITGETFSADTAKTAGFVDEVGSAEAIDSSLAALLSELRKNGIEAMRATKRLLRDTMRLSLWDEVRELTTQTIASRRVSAEGQEGMKAFLEKREPSWR